MKSVFLKNESPAIDFVTKRTGPKQTTSKMRFRHILSLVGLVLGGCSGRLDVGDQAPAGDAGARPVDPALARTAIARSASVVGVGTGHACAILEDTTVACWGFNRYGQAGVKPEDSLDPNGDPYVLVPGRVPGIDGVVQISAGWQSTYVLRSDGTVYAWGATSWTPHALPVDDVKNVPRQVPGVSEVVKVVDGGGPACALRRDGTVLCWGSDISGKTMDVLAPAPVAGITDAVDLSVDDGMACVIHRDGDVSCWGSVQIVTDDYTQASATPVKIPGVHKAVEVAIAASAAIALLEDGTVMGWGASDAQTAILEQIQGPHDPRVTSYDDGVPPAVFPGLTGIASVRAQYRTMCALRATDGSVVCWGRNDVGELGQGRTTIPISEPTPVEGVVATQLSVGSWSSCFVDDARRLTCWGNGSNGTLGTGAEEKYASKPVKPVLLPAPLAPKPAGTP